MADAEMALQVRLETGPIRHAPGQERRLVDDALT
jgi:hypothetical protein